MAPNPIEFPALPSGVFDRYISDTYTGGGPSGTPIWDRLWFNPGRVPQSAELNEMQSMLYYQLNKICEELFIEGQIISGCAASVSGTTLTVASGFIYIQGRIRYYAGGSVTITGSGTETVGLVATITTLVPQSDPELLNPVTAVIVGPGQYSLLGASRMSVTFVLTHNGGTTLFTIVGGVVQANNYPAYGQRSPLVQVAYSPTPVFDCSLGNADLVVFEFLWYGNVTGGTIINAQPGQVVKFILISDSTPGHTFVWPGYPPLAGATVPPASAVVTNYMQSFITLASGIIIADHPMVINP